MYDINFWDCVNGWVRIATVGGAEAAYGAYRKACELAELLGKDCSLTDGETGEALAQLEEE